MKYIDSLPDAPEDIVTTCVVVWIEIHGVNVGLGMGYSHHLRGGVD